VRVVVPAQAELGEGAIWNPLDQRLYWVDIEGRQLHILDPATGQDRALPTGGCVGTVVPTRDGAVLVALQTGLHRLNPVTGQLSLLQPPPMGPNLRFNDGKCDPAGRLWVGTLHLKGHPHCAALYRFDPDGRLHTMLTGVSLSNGLAWSLDQGTMYYIDTLTRAVQAFDYEPATGAITNGRVIIRIPDGAGDPDGMTIDAQGRLWIALWGGGQVACFDPFTGQQVAAVHVPAPHASSCAFGGPELRTMFITTARQGLSPAELAQYPLSGSVFATEPGVAGVPANIFGQVAR